MLANQLQQLLIALLKQLKIVVVCREIVCAKINAYHFGLITAEVPLLTKETCFLAQFQIEGISSILILYRHARAGRTSLNIAIITISSYTATGHNPMLGIQVACCYRCIAVIMVFCGIIKMLFFLQSLVTISTGYRVSYKFYFARRECRSLNKTATFIKHKSPELRIFLVTLNNIHQFYQMTSFGQCCSKRNH